MTIDTLAYVKALKEAGVPAEQAEGPCRGAARQKCA
jgi:hypothetical protein